MTATDSTGETILIIDDHPTNLEVLYDALDGAGYKVLVEMDGWHGIETIKRHPPDLILLDIMMPGIDGFETCQHLQSEPTTCEIPIIFMSALTDTTDKVKGLGFGAVDYITKPFQQEEVLARIKIHLKLRQANLELAQQKDVLEQRVQERTTGLSQALDNLKNAQLQLVQSEKMATLGNLVAGVAHEINNPIGFLQGSLIYTEKYIQDLLAHIQLLKKHHPSLAIAVIDHARDIELEFLTQDLPKLVKSMNTAAECIINISNSLRTFSRSDTSHKVAFNIHEGIDSTLLILKYRLKANSQRPDIEVITEYGNLPRIKCFPGQLNQVFMNILANAIDALDESNKVRSFHEIKNNPNRIVVKTSVENKGIKIVISDNAQGMSEEVKENIFNQLFTTKDVGKGTGLGLAIARQIVEETHHGKLSFNSVLGKGTEFFIEIPV